MKHRSAQHFFWKSKKIHKNFVGGFDFPLCPSPWLPA